MIGFTSWCCQFSGISSVAACSRCPKICSIYVTYGAFPTWGSQKNGWLVISHLEMDDFGALGYLLFRKPPYHSQSHGICPLGFHLHPPRTLPPEAARQAHTIAQPNPPLFLSARLGTQEMKRNWDRNRVWMAYWCLAGNGGIGWWFIDVNSFHGYRTRHCFAVPSCLTVRDMGNCTAFPTTSTSRTVKIGSEEYILFIIIIIYILSFIYIILYEYHQNLLVPWILRIWIGTHRPSWWLPRSRSPNAGAHGKTVEVVTHGDSGAIENSLPLEVIT